MCIVGGGRRKCCKGLFCLPATKRCGLKSKHPGRPGNGGGSGGGDNGGGAASGGGSGDTNQPGTNGNNNNNIGGGGSTTNTNPNPNNGGGSGVSGSKPNPSQPVNIPSCSEQNDINKPCSVTRPNDCCGSLICRNSVCAKQAP